MKIWKQGDVAERWKRQYFRRENMQSTQGTWGRTQLGDTQTVYTKLVGLEDPVKINEIIGNDTWTRFMCDNCRTYKTKGIIFEEANGEGDAVHICLDCIKEAYKLICS